jgi:hypothetical protein
MNKSVAFAALALVLSASASAGLTNGGFETPGYPANSVSFPVATLVPGWNTSATDNKIEIWTVPFNGVPSYEGNQFAELNANQVSTLFQDASGIASGSVVGYQFAHRGRAGVDTMRFELTDLGANGVAGGGDDTLLFSRTVSTGNTAWGFYSGSGILALGNTVRFSFISVSAAGGATVGNFLDAADFGVGVGVPEPGALALAGLGLALVGLSRRKKA